MIREHQYRSDYNGGPCTYKWHLTPCGRPQEDHEQVDYKTKQWDEQDANEKRVTFLVQVDLDQLPGSFHTPERAERDLRAILEQRINHYNPTVKLVTTDPMTADEFLTKYNITEGTTTI